MTDEFILQMVADGRLRIDRDTLQVEVWHRSHKRWHVKKEDYHPISGRARYRIDTPDVKRATVYKNRLVFLYFGGKVAQGNVDHKDGDRTNDRPNNLGDQLPDDSAGQGQRVWLRMAVAEACNWFDFVARYGTVPPDGWRAEIPL